MGRDLLKYLFIKKQFSEEIFSGYFTLLDHLNKYCAQIREE